MTMQISLSTTSAPEQWGKNALLSANELGMTIHVKDFDDHSAIQRAARKIKSQGIEQVALNGENWGLEQCWAFEQGFYSVKNPGNVQYPVLSKQAEFEQRRQCTAFLRDVINAPSDELTPQLLAEKAAHFLTEQAKSVGLENAINYKIISGEALREQGYVGIWTVGKGSANPPAMLQLDFNPSNDPNAPVLAYWRLQFKTK